MMDSNSSSKNKIALIIAAAGSSTRMGGAIKKEYLPLMEGTVLSTCAKIFINSIELSSITITIPSNDINHAKDALYADSNIKALLNKIPVNFVEGGETRQKSILNALIFLDKNANSDLDKPDYVIIHDGARPFVTSEIIKKTLSEAFRYEAAVPGINPVDTQKIINDDGFITTHLKRSNMIAVQTPQIFLFQKLLVAHKKAEKDNMEYTDDTEIWGKYIGQVKTTSGDVCNKKITYSNDYKEKNTKNKMILRTGLGYDLHRLVTGRKLIIGGIEIPFEKGEDGHSDGDTLLHAITDALLGASGLGDIGSFFPPEDNKWKNADSIMLLKTVWKKIKENGWKINNIDCVIKLEKPKFIPYREKVIESIAKALNIDNNQIFVKAKTGEKLDSVGNGNAIEAWCSCILIK